jgi:hypothetical protein
LAAADAAPLAAGFAEAPPDAAGFAAADAAPDAAGLALAEAAPLVAGLALAAVDAAALGLAAALAGAADDAAGEDAGAAVPPHAAKMMLAARLSPRVLAFIDAPLYFRAFV